MPRLALAKIPANLLQAELARRSKKAGKKLAKLIRKRAKLDDQISQLETLTGGTPKAKPGPKPGKKRGRKPGPKPAAKTKVPRKKRGHFKQNASQFILGLVKKAPKTTSQIGKKWKAAGRGGKADNALTKLVKDGMVKREKLAEGQGSTYTLA
jgi:hypothetical protein